MLSVVHELAGLQPVQPSRKWRSLHRTRRAKMPSNGETQRYKSYGKQRVHAGTKHSDWMAVVHSGSSAGAASASTMSSSGADVLSPTWEALHERQLLHDQHDAAALKKKTKEPNEVDLTITPDHNNKVLKNRSRGDALPRQRKVSIASNTSSSSSSSSFSAQVVRPLPTQTSHLAVINANKARRMRVVESPPPTPLPILDAAYASAKPREPRAALLNRKDSNDGGKVVVSPVKAELEGKDTDHTSSMPNVKIKKTTCENGHALEFCRCGKSKTIDDTMKNKNVPAAGLHPQNLQTPVAVPAATPNRKNQINTSFASISSMYVAPPRGHGIQANAHWRRPLTPLVIGQVNRIGGARKAGGAIKGKRPPRKYEPVSPVPAQTKKSVATAVQVGMQHMQSQRKCDELAVSRLGKVEQNARKSGERSSQAGGADKEKASFLRDCDRGIIEDGPKCRDKTIALVETMKLLPAVENLALPTRTYASRNHLPLLEACSDSANISLRASSFSSFIDDFHLIPPSITSSMTTWKKIGEATYSEVFTASFSSLSIGRERPETQEVVVKIIPLYMESLAPPPAGLQEQQDDEKEIPQTSLWQDIEREIRITSLLSDSSVSGGYPCLKGAYLVRGDYPPTLLRAWDDFKTKTPKTNLNPRPGEFPHTVRVEREARLTDSSNFAL